jgi:molybdopterin converting factor small subunit
MARILIPTALRQFAEKHDNVELPGATVGDVLHALTTRFPDLKKNLYSDEGKLRSFVNVYLNDEDIRYINKESSPVTDSDVLSIVPSIAGGKHA